MRGSEAEPRRPSLSTGRYVRPVQRGGLRQARRHDQRRVGLQEVPASRQERAAMTELDLPEETVRPAGTGECRCAAHDDLGYLRDLITRKLRKGGNGVEVTGSGYFFAPPIEGMAPEDQPRPEADISARIGEREYRITIREGRHQHA